MGDVSFRVRFGSSFAPASRLDTIEEITVDQEIDKAWEGRIRFPVCLDDRGQWTGEDADFMDSFSRVRIEVSTGGAFVPLVDGPVVGRDSSKSSEPGRSTVTLVVHDDSAFLNREERFTSYEGLSDHEIVERIFDETPQIRERDVERTPPHTDSLPAQVVRRGTAMSLLRQLARRQGMHVYVLPGREPEQSKGCFKPLPTDPSDLPPLVLLGANRNVRQLDVSADDLSSGSVEAHALNVSDKGVVTSTSRTRDVRLLGSSAREPVNEPAPTRLAAPTLGSTVDLERRTGAGTERASYGFLARGETIDECYGGVLRPYEVVRARGLNDRDSGSFLIHRVTHTLSRSSYGQSFTLRRNARSTGAAAAVNDLIGSLF